MSEQTNPAAAIRRHISELQQALEAWELACGNVDELRALEAQLHVDPGLSVGHDPQTGQLRLWHPQHGTIRVRRSIVDLARS